MTTFLLISLLTVVLLAAVGAQGIALAIAGVVAPVVSQLFKNWIGTGGFKAVLLAGAVSAVIAVIASFIAGDVHDAGEVVKNASAVFGLATLVYRAFVAAGTSSSGG